MLFGPRYKESWKIVVFCSYYSKFGIKTLRILQFEMCITVSWFVVVVVAAAAAAAAVVVVVVMCSSSACSVKYGTGPVAQVCFFNRKLSL